MLGPRTCAASVPVCARTAVAATCSKKVTLPPSRPPSAGSSVLERFDADRLQIVPEYRLDRPLPTFVDLERLGQARFAGGLGQRGEPAVGARILLAQRRLLQRLERQQLGTRLLTLAAHALEPRLGGMLRGAQLLQQFQHA